MKEIVDYIRSFGAGSGTVGIVWAYIALLVIEIVSKVEVPTEIKEVMLATSILTLRRSIGSPIQTPKVD